MLFLFKYYREPILPLLKLGLILYCTALNFKLKTNNYNFILNVVMLCKSKLEMLPLRLLILKTIKFKISIQYNFNIDF